MARKKAVITGGAGFIGSHLCEHLIELGWTVDVVDDLSLSDGSNIAHLKGSGVKLHVRSVEDLDFMSSMIKDCDGLFHLAAMVSVPLSVERPVECYRANLTAFSDLLDVIRSRPVPVVYASSAAIYGEGTDDGPRRESEVPMPQSPYGASKAMDELVAAVASRCYSIPTVGLRLFNVYGPRQNPKGAYASVIPRFATAMIDGNPATIFGDGEQTRDFLFVKDVARVMVKVAEQADPSIPLVMNVGSGVRESVGGVYRILSSMVQNPLPPEFMPERPGDIKHSFADLTKLSAIMDLSSFVGLEEGIERTLAYYVDAKS